MHEGQETKIFSNVKFWDIWRWGCRQTCSFVAHECELDTFCDVIRANTNIQPIYHWVCKYAIFVYSYQCYQKHSYLSCSMEPFSYLSMWSIQNASLCITLLCFSSWRNPFHWVVTVTKIFMNKLRELSRNLWTFWKLLGLIFTKNIEIVPEFQRCPETMVFHPSVVSLPMIGILFHPCEKEWIVIGRPFLLIVQPKVVHGLVASFR